MGNTSTLKKFSFAKLIAKHKLSCLLLLILFVNVSSLMAHSLGNRVFLDKNRSGKYEATDEPIAFTTVHLYSDANNDNVPDGAFIGTTMTDANGLYYFVNLQPGNYIVGAVIPSPLAITVLNGGDPDNNIDNDNNAVKKYNGEAIGNAITITTGGEPTDGSSNYTYDIGLYNPILAPDGGKSCFAGNNSIVWAKSTWTANVNDETVTIRTTFAKTFVDNTYGTSAIGWSNGHTFSNLTGSDNLTWSIRDANGIEKLKFQQDYISSSSSFPSGYGTLGFGGDGASPSIGLASDVLSFRTSMDVNFNNFGYVLTTNSPATDTNYKVNATYPNWINEVWYEVTVKKSAFGAAGFGYPIVASVHASPSKTGNNTEIVTQVPCGDGSIGDYVWNDQNGNGIQDAEEPGISGATVTLTYPNNAIATTTTTSNGYYEFKNLSQGNYTVAFSTPSGFVPTTSDQGANDGKDSDPVNGSVAVTLTNGQTNLTVDAGFISPASVGDYVWNDLNGNGIQDANEPGIEGVTVTLTYPNNTTATTTTNASGAYMFNNLPAGTYSISFSAPSIYLPISANQGADDTKDSDPVGGVVSGIVLTAGQSNTTIDAGFYIPLGSIGDRVWNDVDKNGVQDLGEIGVAGVTVTLYNSAGVVLSTTITDAYGNYLFSNLSIAAAGTDYKVRFSLPAQYRFTGKGQSGDAETDSDADLVTGKTANVTLTPANKDRADVDAGIYYTIPAKIGDFIWNDLNGDGFQDAGEPGIAGVTITLYNNAGIAVASTITDNNGYYKFTDVAVGIYTLKVSAPVGFVASPKDAAGDDTKDSDFDPTTLKTNSFIVSNGTLNLTFDGGFVAVAKTLASVGDRVWMDLNNNDLQDAGEPGVAGVTVELYTGAGVLVSSMLTDAFGYYIFNNLTSGTYYVKFSNIPAGYSTVTANVGGVVNASIDSDITGTNGIGTTNTFTLVAGESKVTIDGGIRSAAVTNNSRLGDVVWYDLNKNGIQDGGLEVGVPGVTVILYNASTGAVVKSTTTDINGKYLFTDLVIGSYIVGVSNLPAGYLLTAKDQGANDATDNDADATTGRTGIYTIAADGTTNLTVDAGIASNPNVRDGKATIGDKVWNDRNANGMQDINEPGIAGVTVTLYAGNGTTVIATTTTDGLGNYIFTNLDAGSYVVGFSGLPGGYQFTTAKAGTDGAADSDANTTTGKTTAITLVAGEVNMSLDAGLIATSPKSSLGDRVWFDNNGNGIQDAGETGVAGVSVTLYDGANNILKTTVTNTNGNYLFTDLNAGSYVIGFTNIPTGYVPTIQNALGSSTENNSDANTAGLTTTIVLPAITNDLVWDMGIVSSSRASVGDYVWSDVNGDGIQNATEKGIAGITVTLYDEMGVPVANTVTDANGFYTFSNIIPGTYIIGFSNIPVNSGFTTKNASGSTDANNSDANPTGLTDAFVLVGGQIKTDIDAGLVSNFAAVGNYVWYDVNVNGRQDANEPGVPGVVATLYNANNIKIASAVTDGNGLYFINNIPVTATSNFTIIFTNTPINTQGFTIKNAPGTNANNNSDVSPATGKTDVFTLSPGQIRLDIDAGIITTTGGPLPIAFASLKGTYTNGVSSLNWATLSELNFSHFELEYSTDGNSFNKISDINAAGNSTNRMDYGYTHKQPTAGANYYRLKLVDQDGRFTYSNIVVLNVTVKGISITGVYPNPFIDRVNVSVTTEKSDIVKVRLFDQLGQLIRNQQSTIQSGVNIITVNNLSTLSAGTYILEVKTADKVLTQKLIK